MRILRRRLASGALALSLLQLGLLFAAPMSACCLSRMAAQTAATDPGADDAPDCCPPGAHPKGECPLHKGKSGRATHCSFRCGGTAAPQLLLGAIGVLPAPPSSEIPFTASALPSSAFRAAILRPVIPDAPPPERV
jgi:hypothetical protein